MPVGPRLDQILGTQRRVSPQQVGLAGPQPTGLNEQPHGNTRAHPFLVAGTLFLSRASKQSTIHAMTGSAVARRMIAGTRCLPWRRPQQAEVCTAIKAEDTLPPVAARGARRNRPH